MTISDRPVSRRALLLAGGGTVAAATAAGVVLARREKQTPPPPGAVGLFDIDAAAELLRPTPLHDITGPQSIAFDEHGRMYALQVMQGGIRLPDEERPASGKARRLAGDMCVTAYARGGAAAGHMYLRGFGHGISMGVEPSGDGPLLWVECDADTGTGYGRAVARVPFHHGTVLDSTSPSVRHHRPLPGSHRIHPAVDVAGGRVLLSHRAGRSQRYTVYALDDFLSGSYKPLADLRNHALRGGETLQGCAVHGDHIYQLTGTPYTDPEGANPPEGGGNTYVSAIDVRSGRTIGRRKVSVAPHLPFREPEGLAVRPGARPELCVAFSVKSGDRRNVAVYACPS
ncbi:signaling protein [Streptomyces sp. JH34]|uniref:signaling protein n=1 Tax=Streptomyces sp. JH34 TaxID=2793633 RepID=UPI0023F79EFF|nr:signaling protein [Streptomyces sp. JH34]MDF6018116.1 signaling protein [Streptomyces sp. JH34]